MMNKTKTDEKEVVRAGFRFHGAELAQLREVRDMLNLNSEIDAARYLMQRGLEVMTQTLTNRRIQGKLAVAVDSLSAESMVAAMISQMQAQGYEVDPAALAKIVTSEEGKKCP